jgi:hypothetical protein
MATQGGGMPSPRNSRNLALVLFLAPVLTLVFFHQFQPFHMDEGDHTLTNVSDFFYNHTVVPKEASYASFFDYLATLFIGVWIEIAHAISSNATLQDYAIFLRTVHPIEFVAGGRLLSFICLCASVIAMGDYLAKRFSLPAAVTGTALLLTPTSLIIYSGSALPDLLLLVCTVGTFLAFVGDSSRQRRLLISAAFAGLATAAKYNGASCVLFILIMIAADGFKGMTWRIVVLDAVRVLAVSLGVFLIATPSWLVAPDVMLGGLLIDMRHGETGHLGGSGVPLLGQIEILLVQSPVFIFLALLGMAAGERRCPILPADQAAFVFVVSALILPAINRVQFPEYLFPAYPAICYFAARASFCWIDRRVAIAVSIGAVLFASITNAGAVKFLEPDSNTLAKQWILAHVAPTDRITLDWAYVPDLISGSDMAAIKASKPYVSSSLLRAYFEQEPLFTYEREGNSTFDIDLTRSTYFVTSRSVFARFFDFGLFTSRPPPIGTPIGDQFLRSRAFYSNLFESKDWQLSATISGGDGNTIYIFKNMTGGIASK